MPDESRLTDADSVVVVRSGVRTGRPSGAGHPRPVDPFAAARARGQQMQRDTLAAQGEFLDADTVAARLGIRRDEVESRLQQGLVLGLPLESGGVAFPAWQFTHDGLLPGLETVLEALGVRNAWMGAAFFLSGDIRLDGRTPLEALLNGEVEAVRLTAAAYGEQLAS